LEARRSVHSEIEGEVMSMSLTEHFGAEEKDMSDMPTKPEKIFDIDVKILSVPQKEIQKWLDDIAAIEYETIASITEVEIKEETATE